ncbi:MAG TPA: OsmC family protein [Candidatus Limnocylindria bacterium]|nr:OsmC family protein [Candidatus Limnocylindria bacterium]
MNDATIAIDMGELTGTLSVRHIGGDRYDTHVRGHWIVLDQPTSGDAGPTPVEAFVTSLAACAAFYAGRFLARHAVAGHRVECRYEQDAGGAVTLVALTLRTEAALPDGVRIGALRAMEHCAVMRSIRGALDVTVAAEANDPVEA